MEYEIQGLTHCCAASGRTLQAGETYYALLREQEGQFVREDYSAQAWQGPPEGIFGFWKGRVPSDAQKPGMIADPETLLDLFEQLHDPARVATESLKFILALYLMRRKLLKLVHVEDRADHQAWILENTRAAKRYEVLDPALSEEALAAQQRELEQLLTLAAG